MQNNYMHNSEVWDIDRSHEVKRRTWWWYWWIFYLKNPENPTRPRQLMVLWATRNAKKVYVNGEKWFNREGIEKGENEVTFPGLSAGWYYDGNAMHDPLFQVSSPVRAFWNSEHGEVTTKKEMHSRLFYENMSYHLDLKKEGLDVQIDMTPWTEELSRAVPTGRQYFGNLGYKMYKIRGMRAKGSILYGGKTIEVEGTAYFQKVRINSPTSPWYWAAFHGENGEFMDYFVPHMGLPVFRRGLEHKSIFDRWEKHLSNSFEFYDPQEKRYHSLKGIKIERRYENDLPIFTLSGRDGNTNLKAELTTYSRAYWIVKQPLLGAFSTTLVYNEYPAVMTGFSLKYGSNGEREIRLSDIGQMVGNCEHAWGIV